MNINSQRILQAVKAVVAGDMRTAYKSLTVPGYDFGGLQPGIYYDPVFSSVDYRGPAGSWLATIDGNGYNYFKYTGLDSATRAYDECPPLAAIINRKAGAYINGRTWVLNKDNKEAEGAEADKLRALLNNPNPLQSWEEFEAANYIDVENYGFAVVLAMKPYGFTNPIDASALWNIPPCMLDIVEQRKLFLYAKGLGDVIQSITLTYMGERAVLDMSNVFIIKDFVPSRQTLALPGSRIRALQMPINNIIGAYESRNVLINYRGALGVISQDPGNGQLGSMPMTPDQKAELQRDFKRYGLRNKQAQFIITKAAIKWQQMGYPTKELMLFEEVEADTQQICDNYGFPFRLLSSNSSNSLGGTDAGIFGAMLYQDTIIPEANRIYSQWNRIFQLDKYKIRLDKDFTHIPILQEDKVKAGEARYRLNQALLIEWQNNMMTWNEWQVELGKDPKPGMDIYYTDMVAQGKIFGAQPATPAAQGANEQQTPTTAPAAAAA